jgi:hypothetical protein
MMRWLFRRHYQAGEFWWMITTHAVNDVRMQSVRIRMGEFRSRLLIAERWSKAAEAYCGRTMRER